MANLVSPQNFCKCSHVLIALFFFAWNIRGTAYSGNTCDPVKLPKSLLVTLCPDDVGRGRGGFWNVKISKRTLDVFSVFSRTHFMFFFATCRLGSFGSAYCKHFFVVM